MVLAKRDVAKSIKTLIVMLQSLKNQQVIITLRNDTIVTGKIVEVDGQMNIELTDATVEQDLFYSIQPRIGNDRTSHHRQQTIGHPDVKMEDKYQVGSSQEDSSLSATGADAADGLGEEKDLEYASSHQAAAGELEDRSSQLTHISIRNESTRTLVGEADIVAADTEADLLQVNRKMKVQRLDGSGSFSAKEEVPSTANFYDYFIVKGSRVRHIDLPTDCDMIASTKSEIERIRGRHKQWTKRDIVHNQH